MMANFWNLQLRKCLLVGLTIPLALTVMIRPSGASTEGLKNALADAMAQTQGRPDFFGLLAKVFADFDRDGNGLDKDDLETVKAVQRARTGSRVAAMRLAYDLDGDFVITRQELERYFLYGRENPQTAQQGIAEERLKRFVDRAMRADANMNGSLEGAELLLPDEQKTEQEIPVLEKRIRLAEQLLHNDANQDGRITEPEALLLLASFAGEIDLTPTPRPAKDAFGKCAGLTPNPDEPVLLLGTKGGSSIPTVTIAGQDEMTTGATIDIAPGGSQFSLIIVSAEPMIWTFAGDTTRLLKVYLAAQMPEGTPVGAGAVGLPAEKVDFFTAAGCIAAFTERGDANAIGQRLAMERALNRRLNVVYGAALAGNVRIAENGFMINTVRPFDEVAARRDGYRFFGFLGAEAKQRYPGGIVRIKPADVVTAAKAENYEVLPGVVGLSQLAANGDIDIDADRKAWITRKIRLPADMLDPTRLDLRLKPGVPAPSGNPGRSCVFDSEGKTLVAGGENCTDGSVQIIVTP